MVNTMTQNSENCWFWKCFSNKLRTIWRCSGNSRIRNMVTKVARHSFEGNWSLEWTLWMTACLVSLSPSPFNNKIYTYSCHVYSDSWPSTLACDSVLYDDAPPHFTWDCLYWMVDRKAGTSVVAKSFNGLESSWSFLLGTFKMAVPWSTSFLALFSTYINPCIVRLNLV
jgi:hypothetical protein